MAVTVKSINENHRWDYDTDGQGSITALWIIGEVNYGSIGNMERKDIWPVLTSNQKQAVQGAFDLSSQWFSNQFEWE